MTARHVRLVPFAAGQPAGRHRHGEEHGEGQQVGRVPDPEGEAGLDEQEVEADRRRQGRHQGRAEAEADGADQHRRQEQHRQIGAGQPRTRDPGDAGRRRDQAEGGGVALCEPRPGRRTIPVRRRHGILPRAARRFMRPDSPQYALPRPAPRIFCAGAPGGAAWPAPGPETRNAGATWSHRRSRVSLAGSDH